MEKNYRDGLLLRSSNHHRSETRSTSNTTSSDFVLQWGNRKRLRCMKVHNKNSGSARAEHDDLSEPSGSAPAQRTSGRADRRVGRSDPNRDSSYHQQQHGNNTGVSNGYLNLRQRAASPSHRILRNSESSVAMRERSNGLRNLATPDKGGAHDKRGGGAHNNNHIRASHNNNDHHHHHGGAGGSVSSETAHESKKGGSSSGSDAIPAVWPPKFVIALTNKEKEEDFMAIKGSKLPQRPKKRAKFIQRTLNRPRGLKAMGNMDSDSE